MPFWKFLRGGVWVSIFNKILFKYVSSAISIFADGNFIKGRKKGELNIPR